MRSPNCLVSGAVLLLTCCFAATTQADIYRCVNSNGHISYQQIRCHQNSKPLAFNQQRSGWTALRPGERALLNRYRQKDSLNRRKKSDTRADAGNKNKGCQTRRNRLDAIKSKLRRGYRLKDSDKLHRQRSEHEAYLRRFCTR